MKIIKGRENLNPYRSEAATSCEVQNACPGWTAGLMLAHKVKGLGWVAGHFRTIDMALSAAATIQGNFADQLDGPVRSYIYRANGHELHNPSMTRWYLAEVIEPGE